MNVVISSVSLAVDEFKSYAEEKPEYAELFRSYHEESSDTELKSSTIKVNGTNNSHASIKATNTSEAKVKNE